MSSVLLYVPNIVGKQWHVIICFCCAFSAFCAMMLMMMMMIRAYDFPRSSEFLAMPWNSGKCPRIQQNHGYSIGGCGGVVVEYRTRNREVARSTHTRSTACNFEQVANLLCAQANSASYPQRDGK